MPLEIMLVVLVGSALHAVWNTLVKSGSDILLDMVLVTTTGIAGVTAVVVFFLPLPRSDSWGCLAISVLIHQAYLNAGVIAAGTLVDGYGARLCGNHPLFSREWRPFSY